MLTGIGSQILFAARNLSRKPPSSVHETKPIARTAASVSSSALCKRAPKPRDPTATSKSKAEQAFLKRIRTNSSTPFVKGWPSSWIIRSSPTWSPQPAASRLTPPAVPPGVPPPLGCTPSIDGCKARGIKAPAASSNAGKCQRVCKRSATRRASARSTPSRTARSMARLSNSATGAST